MKANKTLKRLAKIEALLSDIKGRHSAKAADLRQVLQDAGAAITRAKEIVSAQAAVKVSRKEKAAPTRKKGAVDKASSRTVISKSAKKSAPRKKVAKEKAAVMTASASAPVQPKASGESAGTGEVY